jgi:hypothetical protein
VVKVSHRGRPLDEWQSHSRGDIYFKFGMTLEGDAWTPYSIRRGMTYSFLRGVTVHVHTRCLEKGDPLTSAKRLGGMTGTLKCRGVTVYFFRRFLDVW